MRRRRRALAAAALATALLATGGCTRRQVIPGVVAGAGAAMLTSGAIYRATLDTDEPFGETDGEIATTTVLIFGGLAALITGVVVSMTMTHCESNSDCWGRDVCELRSHTCISREAARSLSRPARDAEGEQPEPAEPATPAPTEEELRPPYPG